MATRRRFLEIATSTTCAACVGALGGCGGSNEAPGLAEDVVVRLADHPDLAEVGGMVELGSDLTGYDHPIFLRNDGNDEFTALGAYCNHEGCSVQPSSSGFRCPCHGATFDADGMLRGGPATADLVSFDTTSDGTTVTILAG
ncbi:MAG: Rieske 2Fe-2S domain-containing protein [Myxococcales bacterium]|nr:Rieske 2Fe-2S domain-containing protein [Myxococcales bacterium]